MPLARDILIDILRDEGVTHIFGNPGSTEMPLMDALVDAPDLTYVLGLQEATAVGMADGWALASGKVGFVNLHAMGGLGNAMGVLVASKASETPLVVTAGQQDTRHLMTEPWLSGDLVGLAAPVVKWAREVRRGEDVGQALRRAFAIARTPPCGPVFLSLPMDVLDQEVEGPIPPASAPPRLGPFARRAAARRTACGARPGKSVRAARRRSAGAAPSDGLVAFAESAGFPVLGAQLTSRAAFPSEHPCWAGVMKPDFAWMRERFADAQAIVLVGGRAFVAYPYRAERPVPEGVAVPACRRQPGSVRPRARTPTWRWSATSARRWRRPPMSCAAAAITRRVEARLAELAARRKRRRRRAARQNSRASRAPRSAPTPPCSPRSTPCRKAR